MGKVERVEIYKRIGGSCEFRCEECERKLKDFCVTKGVDVEYWEIKIASGMYKGSQELGISNKHSSYGEYSPHPLFCSKKCAEKFVRKYPDYMTLESDVASDADDDSDESDGGGAGFGLPDMGGFGKKSGGVSAGAAYVPLKVFLKFYGTIFYLCYGGLYWCFMALAKLLEPIIFYPFFKFFTKKVLKNLSVACVDANGGLKALVIVAKILGTALYSILGVFGLTMYIFFWVGSKGTWIHCFDDLL